MSVKITGIHNETFMNTETFGFNKEFSHQHCSNAFISDLQNQSLVQSFGFDINLLSRGEEDEAAKSGKQMMQQFVIYTYN